jgi:hypothetical protein
MSFYPGAVFSQEEPSFSEVGILPAGTEPGGNRDRIVAYRCDSNLVTIESFLRFSTPYVYDLKYPCSNSVDNAMQDVSEKILVAAASEYKIVPPGTGCAVPPNPSGFGAESERSNWIAGAYSNTPDVLVPNDFPCLVAADADQNECCRVVEGAMQFQPSGGYDGDEFRDFVANTLKKSSFTSGESFQTTYRGAIIDYTYTPAETPRDQFESETEDDPRDTNTSVSGIGTETQQTGDDSKVTAMGGALLSGLVVAFIGVLFIVFRRRRQSRYDDEDLEANMSNTDMDAAEGLETLQLDVLSDGNMDRNYSPRRNQERYIESSSHSNAYEYKFDLSSSMKNDVMGTYGGGGPTSMAVTAPYGISGEASDNGSEVDSWAQTDGTVGSLEDNLDEITAEI